MPYIGKSPVGGGFHKLDNLTASATDTYALTLGSAAYYPETANQLLVSLNGVIQAPQDSFTVSGSNLIFDSALTASDSIDFVVALGDVLGVGSVSDGAITTAKIGNSAVTDAKLASTLDLSAKALTMPTGAMLQVQSTAKTDTGSFTGTSFADLTGVSVAITPSSASSKVLIQVHISGFHDTSTYSVKFRLMRGSTPIGIGDAAGSRTQASFAMDSYGSGSQAVVTAGFHFLDSPSTTSATIYKLQGLIDTGTFHFGRGNGDSDNVGHGRYPTIITATEIAG